MRWNIVYGILYLSHHNFWVTYHFQDGHIEVNASLKAQDEYFLLCSVVHALKFQVVKDQMLSL